MTTVTLGAIDMSNYVDYDGIEKIKSKQIVESTFPGTDTSRFQDMGAKADGWIVKGQMSGTDMNTDEALLEGYYDDNDTVSFVYNGTRDVKVFDLKIKFLECYWEFSFVLRAV